MKDRLKSVFDRYYADLCRHALYYVSDEQEAQNVVQEVFVELWNKHQKLLDSKGQIRSYLFTAVRNRSLNTLRDHKKLTHEEDLPSDSGDLRAELEDKEMLEQVVRLMRTLPPKCRHVFLLSRSKGYSNREIAAELDISVKTVENQMTKALKHLRDGLRKLDR